MDKEQLKQEHPVLVRLESVLLALLSPTELDALATFVDSVEFGFSDFITQLNAEVNPQSYNKPVDTRKHIALCMCGACRSIKA